MFQLSSLLVASLTILLCLAAAGIGWFFGAAVTAALVTLIAVACLIAYLGPVLDKAIEIQAQVSFEALLNAFQRMKQQEQAIAIKYIAASTKQELLEAVNIDLLGCMNIRFQIKETDLPNLEA